MNSTEKKIIKEIRKELHEIFRSTDYYPFIVSNITSRLWQVENDRYAEEREE